MKLQRIVTTETQLQLLIGELRKMFKLGNYLRAIFSDEKPRTLPQNALSHAWYQQISTELAEDTILGVKCYCKLHFGIPILRAEDEDFREFYDTAVKPSLSYEQKLKLMAWMPVTSLMNTSHLSQYLDAVKEHYRGRVDLQYPDEYAQP